MAAVLSNLLERAADHENNPCKGFCTRLNAGSWNLIDNTGKSKAMDSAIVSPDVLAALFFLVAFI
jgi:hypothetical protein